jgi:DNA-binding LytR/AlgR family response regulator
MYAIIPIPILITINQDRLLRQNLKSALELNKKLQERKEINKQMVFFESDYNKDSLSIRVNSLLFVNSANNYIDICWLESDKVITQLVRSSLKKAEEILKDYKFIVKCHRSYLVNINHIDKISGSYQGYKLNIQNTDITIPVSQNYITKFKEMI